MKKIIFDLDGTLANNKHRAHLAEAKDWRAYFAACGDDTPIGHVFAVLFTLAHSHQGVEIWSARSDEVRDITEAWLKQHCGRWINQIPLRMRKFGDWRPDVELKEAWLNEEREAGNELWMVFDDRDSVVAMWRRNGVPCFQVAEGDF